MNVIVCIFSNSIAYSVVEWSAIFIMIYLDSFLNILTTVLYNCYIKLKIELNICLFKLCAFPLKTVYNIQLRANYTTAIFSSFSFSFLHL